MDKLSKVMDKFMDDAPIESSVFIILITTFITIAIVSLINFYPDLVFGLILLLTVIFLLKGIYRFCKIYIEISKTDSH